MESFIIYINKISSAFIPVTWSLLWQSSVLIIIIWALTSLIKKSSPGFRYILWLLVLIRLILPPGFTLPSSIGAWGPKIYNSGKTSFKDAYTENNTSGNATSGQSINHSEITRVLPSVKIHYKGVSFSFKSYIFLSWLTGFCILFVYLLTRLMWLQKIKRNLIIPDFEIDSLFRLYVWKMKIKVKTKCYLSDEIKTPILAGFFTPIVIIPMELKKEMSRNELATVIAHELAHVSRFDWVVNWGQIIIGIFYFFHPLLYIANKKIRIEREKACDDIIMLMFENQREKYAENLFRVMNNISKKLPFSLGFIGMAEPKSDLGRRIIRILDPKTKPVKKLSIISIIAISVFALCFLTFSSCSLKNESLTIQAPKAKRYTYNEYIPVTVSVFDENGKPFYGKAEGKIETVSTAPCLYSIELENGVSATQKVEPGKIRCCVYADGYADTVTDIIDGKPGQPLEFKINLQKGFTAEIQVLDENQTPIDGVKIEGSSMNIPTPRRIKEITKDGKSVLANCINGKMMLTLSKDGFQTKTEIINLSNIFYSHTIVLNTSDVSSGRVQDKNTGLPVSGATIKMIFMNGQHFPFSGGVYCNTYTTQTNSEGIFELKQLTENSNSVFLVDAPGYSYYYITDVIPGRTNYLAELIPSSIINGKILNVTSGLKSLNRIIGTIDYDNRPYLRYTRFEFPLEIKGTTGYFTYENKWNEELKMQIDKTIVKFTSQKPVEDFIFDCSKDMKDPLENNKLFTTIQPQPTPDETILKDYDFSADFVDEEGNKIKEEIHVYTNNVIGDNYGIHNTYYLFNGEALKANFKEGKLNIQANSSTFSPINYGPIDINQPLNTTIKLKKGFPITLKIIDLSGKSLDDVRVYAYKTEKDEKLILGDVSSKNGIAIFQNGIPAKLNITFSKEGYETLEREIEFTQENNSASIMLTPKKSVTGVIFSKDDGSPIKDVGIVKYNEYYTAKPFTFTDEQGRFSFECPEKEFKYCYFTEKPGYINKQIYDFSPRNEELKVEIQKAPVINGKIINFPSDKENWQKITAMQEYKWSDYYKYTKNFIEEIPVDFKEDTGYFSYSPKWEGKIVFFFDNTSRVINPDKPVVELIFDCNKTE